MHKVIEELKQTPYIDGTKLQYFIKKYDEATILEGLKKIVEQEKGELPEICYESQLKLWEQFGYLFSYYHYFPMKEEIIEDITKTKSVEKNMSIEEIVDNGFVLLSKNYLTLIDKNGNIDISKIYEKLKSKKVKLEVLSLLNDYYKNCNIESYSKKNNMKFINHILNEGITGQEADDIDDIILREIKLWLQYQKAKYTLINHNFKLIYSIANKKIIYYAVDINELIQEGYLGMNRAIDGYDIRRKIRFSTYAYYWINQSITYALLEKFRTIRVPANIVEENTKIERITEEYEKKYGRLPTIQELSTSLGLTEKRMENILKYKLLLNCDSINKIIKTKMEFQNENITLEELVEDKKINFEDDIIEEISYQEILKLINKKLTEKEKKALIMYYGLDGNEAMTNREIAEKSGVTHQAIHQLKGKALIKLKESLIQ